MKSIIKKLTLCALSGAAINAHAADVLIPNGDFSTPGGSGFSFFESAAGVVSFPATGGSGDDGGYGLVNNTLGSWGGGLVSPPDNFYPANQGIPLASLGLVAGNTYTFSMDMKNFAGTGKGGLKLEAWNGGAGAASNTGDMPASGSSSSWATYTWNYTIPTGTTSIKIVPVVTPPTGATNADSIGFDNIKVNNTPVVPPPIVPVVPNGDFSLAGGAFGVGVNWAYFSDGFPASHQATGGNPDGNTVIDATGAGGYGVLVAFNNSEVTLASLGLTPGETYTFQMDMKNIAGPNVGGLKLEGPGGWVYENRPAPLAPSGQWATYSFEVTLPLTLNQFKIVPLWGISSSVAYDNVKILLPGPPPPFVANIKQGTVVGWTVNDPDNTYQPQKRNAVEDPWANIGAPVPGTSVPYVFEETASNFYRVLETEPALLQNAVLNPGFETSAVSTNPADNWNTLVAINGGTATVLESYTGGFTPHSGSKMLVLESVTPAEGPVPAPDVVVRSDNFAVTENTSYNLSFWAAHVVKIGGGNPQFSLFFQDGFGGPVGGPVFVSFASIGDTWTKVQHTFTTPAGAATMNVGWIQAVGAGNAWQWVTLLDDVELLTPSLEGSVNENEATAGPGVEVSWQSIAGRTYQVRSSGNLIDWANFGSSVVGNGDIYSVADPITPPGKKFYQVAETP